MGILNAPAFPEKPERAVGGLPDDVSRRVPATDIGDGGLSDLKYSARGDRSENNVDDGCQREPRSRDRCSGSSGVRSPWRQWRDGRFQS